jgi:hypothetical protein
MTATTTTVDAQPAKRTRRVTKPAETPQETPGAGEAAPVKRTRRARKKTDHPVTTVKVHLGVQDLAGALYRDAVARVGGERNLYRIRVLSPSRYEVDLNRS